MMISLIIFHKCICFIDITLYTGILSYSIITIKMFIFFLLFLIYFLCVFGRLVVKQVAEKEVNSSFKSFGLYDDASSFTKVTTTSYGIKIISFIDGLVQGVCQLYVKWVHSPFFPITLIYHFPTPSRSPGTHTIKHISVSHTLTKHKTFIIKIISPLLITLKAFIQL